MTGCLTSFSRLFSKQRAAGQAVPTPARAQPAARSLSTAHGDTCRCKRCTSTMARAGVVELPDAKMEHTLNTSFKGAVPAKALLSRVVRGLEQHGFTAANTIAITATCRDEICRPLTRSLEDVYGSAFEITGLGGFLTCGVIGLKAGLSHAPAAAGGGRDRYLFLAFPHVGIQEDGTLGKVRRPGQDDASAACGALVASLGALQKGGSQPLLMAAGKHSPDDPEFSILAHRLATRCAEEGISDADLKNWDLADLTKAAERQITADLEHLISKAVDPSTADYAVVTGVQIHVTTHPTVSPDLSELVDFILPSASYVVVGGTKRDLHLSNGV